MFLMIVTFCSAEYPFIERNTILFCEVMAHADIAMQSAVKKPEFYSAFGKIAVKIYSMIPGVVIVLVTDAASISIICATIPNLFCLFF